MSIPIPMPMPMPMPMSWLTSSSMRAQAQMLLLFSLTFSTNTVTCSQPRFMFNAIDKSRNFLKHHHPNNAYFSSRPVQLSSTSTTTSLFNSKTQEEQKRNTNQEDNNFDIFESMDEVSDCFHPYHSDCHVNDDDDEEEEGPFAFHANIEEHVIIPTSATKYQPPPLHNVLQKAIRGCYQTCPGVMYSSSLNSSATMSATTAQTRNRGRKGRNRNQGLFGVHETNKGVQVMSSLLQRKSKTDATSPPTSTKAPTKPEIRQESSSAIPQEDEVIQEPSQRILSGIVKPLVPTSIWNSLTGNEFFYPSTLSNLVQTGIRMTMAMTNSEGSTYTIVDDDEGDYIEWKPADSKTKKLLADTQKSTEEEEKKSLICDALLQQNQILVWIGKFTKKNSSGNGKNKDNDDVYGSSLPVVKSISIIPLSPKKFAELLMDSTKVGSYNKLSLGRKDVLTFQQGVDTETDVNSESEGAGINTIMRGGRSFALDGEAKIVRNVTKPPVSKKLVDFVTLMYARRLKQNDNVVPGYLGGGTVNTDGTSSSYIVISRAVSGGSFGCANGSEGSDKNSSNDNKDDDKDQMNRSEILLGVNLLRSIPGEPDKTEVTSVTHVYSPSIPKMLANSIGVSGAINFVKDIRALCE